MVSALPLAAPELPPQAASAMDPATEAAITPAFHFRLRLPAGLLMVSMLMYVTRLCSRDRCLGCAAN
jgi:hypothetical protein